MSRVLISSIASLLIIISHRQSEAGLLVTGQFLSGSTAGTEVLNLSSLGQVLSGNTQYQYNTINDATGAKLVTSNGDANDFTLAGSSTSGALGSARVVVGATGASSPLDAVASGRIGDQHSFTGSVSSNNPGSIIRNTFTLLFNSNLTVTDATFDFSSLNTAGISWEYSVIQFLDSTGNPFSTLTNPGWIIGATSQYSTAGSGFSGQAGTGNFIAARTGTVTGVGTAMTAGGTSGTDNNISSFNYTRAGLTTGTQIGGIKWSTYLEDVRGTSNGNTNLTSSLLDFTISGMVTPATAVPEPSSMLLLAFGCAGMAGSYYCRRKVTKPTVY